MPEFTSSDNLLNQLTFCYLENKYDVSKMEIEEYVNTFLDIKKKIEDTYKEVNTITWGIQSL